MSKFKGFVAGAILGTAGALLLAPKSGRELRKDIKDAIENNDWFSFDIEYLADDKDIEDVKEDAQKVVEDVKEDINEVAKELEDEDIVIDLKNED